ncbi:MAG TPA: hypothetical protein VE445_01345, partial [Nitrososphaeraceae archaeon]|nr:hypothetical protein [Nitrososphaeraceae archaeon]
KPYGSTRYLFIWLNYMATYMSNTLSTFIFSLLPKGTVKDEMSFFIMLSVLIVLIGIAIVLRRRH